MFLWKGNNATTDQREESTPRGWSVWGVFLKGGKDLSWAPEKERSGAEGQAYSKGGIKHWSQLASDLCREMTNLCRMLSKLFG